MTKHCKDCKHHHSAGRRNPTPFQVKFNNWCCKRGAVVDVGWCKTHSAKETK
jgi:hypothetical protein